MAWPDEAGSLGVVQSDRKLPRIAQPSLIGGKTKRPRKKIARKTASGVFPVAVAPRGVLFVRSMRKRPVVRRPASHPIQTIHRSEFYLDLRGKYRVFNDAGYRFYRSLIGPPDEGAGHFAINATLPYEPADTFGDGVWYLSVSYFNGVLDSGFLPLGDRGEEYLRLAISGGVATSLAPDGPQDFRIEATAGGVVRVTGLYINTGSNLPDSWAITYTTNGSTPADDSHDIAQDMTTSMMDVLQYDLPAQAHGTTVKVRLQTLVGSTYSENSTMLTATALVDGPSVPLHGERWPGRVKVY